MPLVVDPRGVRRSLGFTFAPRALRYGVLERYGLGADEETDVAGDTDEAVPITGGTTYPADATPEEIAAADAMGVSVEDVRKLVKSGTAPDTGYTPPATTGGGASPGGTKPAVYVPSVKKTTPDEPDYTIWYVAAGAVVLIGGSVAIYYATKKKPRHNPKRNPKKSRKHGRR
jgi:hypothetical protein